MRYIPLALVALLAVACGSGMQRQGDSPWGVPPEQFFATVKTIGVAPFRADPENPEPIRALLDSLLTQEPTILAQFDSLLIQQLRLAGYTVVQVPEMWEFAAEAQMLRILETSGARAYDEQLFRRLAAAHPNVDAFLNAGMATGEAVVAFDGRFHAHFWGATQSLPADVHTGPLTAFIFCARLIGPGPELLYHGDGGIGLAHVTPKPFADQDRNLNAVRYAFGPILQRPE